MIKEYIHPAGYTYVRLSELPEHEQEELLQFISGQTVPQVEGLEPPEAIFSWDYYRYKARSNGKNH